MPDRPADEDAQSDLLQQMLEDASHEHGQGMQREVVEPPPVVLDPRVAETKQTSKREILLAEIDAKISAVVDEVVQHPTVQRLAATWAALGYLVDHVDFDENIRVALLNCSKDDLANDFEEAIDVTVTGLYRRLCEPGHPPSDRAPFSLIVADYDFDHRQQDTELLRQCAAVAADAHAPFVANTSPRFFGCESFAEFPGLRDLSRVFASPRYAAWGSFRSSEDARYVALCAPPFALRSRCANDDEAVDDLCSDQALATDGDTYVRGPGSYVFAVQVAKAFAKYRWFDRLTDVLPLGSEEDPPAPKEPHSDWSPAIGQVEVALSEGLLHEISDQGFIALRDRGDGTVVADSAVSTQRPKHFADTPEGRAAELDCRTGALLSNVLNISRVAHYLEAVGRELGVSDDAESLERALQRWLAEQLVEGAPTHHRKPLREANLTISDRGYYRYELQVRPAQEALEFDLRVAGSLGATA
jgi:type VI secretion system protein ImpC